MILFDTSFKSQIREFFRSEGLPQHRFRPTSKHSEGSGTQLSTFSHHFAAHLFSSRPVHERLWWPWPPPLAIPERLREPQWLPNARPKLWRQICSSFLTKFDNFVTGVWPGVSSVKVQKCKRTELKSFQMFRIENTQTQTHTHKRTHSYAPTRAYTFKLTKTKQKQR